MIKTIFRWITLLALCNATQSFFNANPYMVKSIMKRNYSQNFLTLRRMSNDSNDSNGSNDSNDTQSIPVLRPKPIPVISFDVLFLNWNNINRIYLSSDSDRIIILYGNDKKGVYYIHTDQLNKIEFLLSKTSAIITIEPVCNLDNKWYHLYCSPYSGRGNAIDDIAVSNKTIEIYNSSNFVYIDNTTNKNDDNDYDDDEFNDDYGFDFGLGM